MWRVHRYKVRKITGVQHVTHVSQTILPPETSATSYNNRGLLLVSQNLLILFLLLSQPANKNIDLTFIHIFLHSLFTGAKLSTPSFDRTSLFDTPKFTQKRTKNSPGHAPESTFPAFQPSQKSPYIRYHKNLKSAQKDEYYEQQYIRVHKRTQQTCSTSAPPFVQSKASSPSLRSV